MNQPTDPEGQASPKCGAKTPHGPCKLPAGRGTTHRGYGRCDFHGGSTPTHVTAARRAQAEDAARRFGVPIETTGQDALFNLLYATAGEVAFYRAQVAALPAGALISGTSRARRTVRGDGTTETETVAENKPHVWLVLLNDAERRHLEVAATIVKLGIEQQQVDVARKQADRFYRIMLASLGDLGIRQDDPRVLEVLPRRIRELSA